MFQLIAKPLEFFYELWPNYAGAISLLTLSIMILLLPLTLKGTRSMLAMQKLQPELKKLQNKHRDDRQKMNEEVMKFYKENNINPVSGCFPLLLQMPVFFFLYRTLYELLNRAPYGQDMGAAVGRAASGRNQGVFSDFGTFRPKHLNTGSQLYQDLSHTRHMRSFGVDLAESAVKAVSHGIGHAFPFIVLVVVVTATSFIQQRQIAGRNPQAAQANPQQAMMMKIIPLFLAFFSLTLPAGIVVYFLVSNVFRIGQQALITRTMYGDQDTTLSTTGRETDTSDREPEATKPKGFLAQLREAGLPDPGKARQAAADRKGTTATLTKVSGSKPAVGNRNAAKAPVRNGSAKARGSKATGEGTKAKVSDGKASNGQTGKKRPANGSAGSRPELSGSSPTAVGRKGEASSSIDAVGSATAPPRPSRSAPSSPNRPRNKKKRK